MATLYTPCEPALKNVAFAIQIALQDMANPGSYKANPTIQAGDFKCTGASNGGNPAGVLNLTVLPSVDPAGSIWVNLQLSATEMNFDQVFVQCIDQTNPKEWADLAFCINTASIIFTQVLPETYNADGAAPTAGQALMLILQRLTEFSISGTTITVKKLDGSTTAATLTLNSAVEPTSSTRAT